MRDHRSTAALSHWQWPIVVLLATVFFVPMRRYAIPLNLPFVLEPYRPLVALVVVAWLLSLLRMDAQLRRTGLDAPIAVLVGAFIASLAVNPSRTSTYQAEAVKTMTLFLTFIATYYLLTSVIRDRRQIEFVVRLIVSFGAVVAASAIVEGRTGFSPFTHLSSFVPFLRDLGAITETVRAGRFRAYGSAEHPIALGAVLAMVTPFAAYLAMTTRRFAWMACGTILIIGTLSTVSRTAVVMLVVILIAVAATRWYEVRRFWFVIFPLLAVIHFASPGTLGAVEGAFRPEGGLVADQSTVAASSTSGGRVTDFAPSLEEFNARPFFGSGMGTRITVGEEPNGRLLDNQWLGLLIDTGIAGVLPFLWLVVRFTRRQFALARATVTASGYLPLACASSALAYAVGMFTYDSFSFTQATFVFFVVLAIGVSYQFTVEPAPARNRPESGRVPYATAAMTSGTK